MDMLKRDVNITGDFGRGCDGLDEFIGPMRGVRVKQPDPKIPGNRIEVAAEDCIGVGVRQRAVIAPRLLNRSGDAIGFAHMGRRSNP